MRRTLVVVLFLIFSIPAIAQTDDDAPMADFSIGYSHLFVSDGDLNAPGWNSTFSYYLNPNFALTGEIGGHYERIAGAKVSQHTFLVGPKITGGEKIRPFGHALFGAARVAADISNLCIALAGFPCPTTEDSVAGFAMAFGGGVDYRFHRNASIRIAQVDWLRARYEGTWTNQARLTFGVVFHLTRN